MFSFKTIKTMVRWQWRFMVVKILYVHFHHFFVLLLSLRLLCPVSFIFSDVFLGNFQKTIEVDSLIFVQSFRSKTWLSLRLQTSSPLDYKHRQSFRLKTWPYFYILFAVSLSKWIPPRPWVHSILVSILDPEIRLFKC